jgi:hypothetical protein
LEREDLSEKWSALKHRNFIGLEENEENPKTGEESNINQQIDKMLGVYYRIFLSFRLCFCLSISIQSDSK